MLVSHGKLSPPAILWIGLAGSYPVGSLAATARVSHREIIPAFFIALIATIWCRLDANARALPWTRRQTYFTFFLYPFAVPIYLLQTMKQRALPAILFALIYGLVIWWIAIEGFNSNFL